MFFIVFLESSIDDNNDGVKLNAETVKEVNQNLNKKARNVRKEIDTKNIIDSTGTPIRQSRRIAQLKIKEEAERRKMEEVALKKMKSDFKKQKQLTEGKDPTSSSQSEQEEPEPEEYEHFKEKIVKGKHGKKKKKVGWSSGSDEQDDEEDEPEHYYDSEKSLVLKSDHEFSPESDIEDSSQIVPLKRARTVRNEDNNDLENNSVIDESCMKCGKADHPELILLCDKCDKGYHCSCLSPVLFYIPEGLFCIVFSGNYAKFLFLSGDWYCPPCQQAFLIVSLEQRLIKFDESVLKKKEDEILRIENEKKKEKEDLLQRTLSKNTAFAKVKKRVKHSDSSNESNDEERFDKSSSEESSIKFRLTKNKASDLDSASFLSSYDDDDDEPIYKLRKRRQINVSYRYVLSPSTIYE